MYICTCFELSENEGYRPYEFERIFAHYENICCSLDYNAENNKMNAGMEIYQVKLMLFIDFMVHVVFMIYELKIEIVQMILGINEVLTSAGIL